MSIDLNTNVECNKQGILGIISIGWLSRQSITSAIGTGRWTDLSRLFYLPMLMVHLLETLQHQSPEGNSLSQPLAGFWALARLDTSPATSNLLPDIASGPAGIQGNFTP